MTRPSHDINLESLKSFMKLYPSLEETALEFDCSPDTVTRLINQEFKLSFAEFRSRFMSKTKTALKRVAIDKALSGDSKMLIYLLKSLCGLRDDEKHKVEEIPTKELVQQAKDLIFQFEKDS